MYNCVFKKKSIRQISYCSCPYPGRTGISREQGNRESLRAGARADPQMELIVRLLSAN